MLFTLDGNSLSISTYLWFSAYLATSICMVTKPKTREYCIQNILIHYVRPVKVCLYREYFVLACVGTR